MEKHSLFLKWHTKKILSHLEQILAEELENTKNHEQEYSKVKLQKAMLATTFRLFRSIYEGAKLYADSSSDLSKEIEGDDNVFGLLTVHLEKMSRTLSGAAAVLSARRPISEALEQYQLT